MKLRVALSLALLLALFVLGPAELAQTGEARTVPLVVMTPAGQLVHGITAQSMRVKDVKAAVPRITFDNRSRRVILLFDVSGSMGEKLVYAKEMAKALLNCAPPDDLFALDVFAQKEKEVVPLTHDFASIRAAIDAVPKPGSKPARAEYGTITNAGDALHTAMINVGQVLGFGDSVIFFSDGEFDNDAGHRHLDSLKAALGQRGIRVFLALAPRGGWPQSDLQEFFLMQAVGDAVSFMAVTGGFSFAPVRFLESGPDQQISFGLQIYHSSPLEKEMTALCEAIQGTYRVELQLDQPLRKRRKLRLEVVDGKGKAINSVFLFYPRYLYLDSSKTP